MSDYHAISVTPSDVRNRRRAGRYSQERGCKQVRATRLVLVGSVKTGIWAATDGTTANSRLARSLREPIGHYVGHCGKCWFGDLLECQLLCAGCRRYSPGHDGGAASSDCGSRCARQSPSMAAEDLLANMVFRRRSASGRARRRSLPAAGDSWLAAIRRARGGVHRAGRHPAKPRAARAAPGAP